MAKYIDKDALVAWAKETYLCENASMIRKVCYKQLLEHLDILEVKETKEVDLEKELEAWRHNHFHGRRDKDASGEYLERSSQLDLAKHFFELGFNASISLTWEDIKLIWTIGDDIPAMAEEDFYKELLRRYKTQKGE